jgi:FkbM family methyltransferase
VERKIQPVRSMATLAKRMVSRLANASTDTFFGYRRHPYLSLRVAVDRKVVSKTTRKAISTGLYEATETRLLPSLVRPEDSVLEIGAGLGFVAALVMLQCRPRAYCAVEADARLIPLIHRTLALNGISAGVDVQCAVLTEDESKLRRGSVPFYVAKDFWHSHVVESETGHNVRTASLNHLLRSRGVTTLIVDIEGGEATLFDGADLSSVQRILVEMHLEIIGYDGMQKLIRDFGERGFAYRDDLFVTYPPIFMRLS